MCGDFFCCLQPREKGRDLEDIRCLIVRGTCETHGWDIEGICIVSQQIETQKMLPKMTVILQWSSTSMLSIQFQLSCLTKVEKHLACWRLRVARACSANAMLIRAQADLESEPESDTTESSDATVF